MIIVFFFFFFFLAISVLKGDITRYALKPGWGVHVYKNDFIVENNLEVKTLKIYSLVGNIEIIW